MKVVLDATGYNKALVPLVEHQPSPLFRLADKPIIEHILELLANEGFRDIELILSHLPERIEDLLHEGGRWGLRLTYHLARNPDHPFAVLGPVVRGWEEQELLLGRADVLPRIQLDPLPSLEKARPLLVFDLKNQWSGWGIFTASQIARLDREATYSSLPERFPKHHAVYANQNSLTLENFHHLHQANLRCLEDKSFQNAFPSNVRMVEPGVWIARSVILHPTARITPPVYIGEGSQILNNTQVGPLAVIENQCVIDSGSKIKSSVITQQSYVGTDLEVTESIVDKNVLVSLAFSTTVTINDGFILGSLKTPSIAKKCVHILERFLALGLSILLLPFVIPLIFWWGLRDVEVVYLPTTDEPEQWKTFQIYRLDQPKNPRWQAVWRYLRQLPSLWNIICGHCHFVGTTPMTPQQVEQLPADWRKLYLSTKVGLVTLAFVDHGSHPSDMDRFASETFYAAHMSVRFDIHVLFQWFVRRSRRLLGLFS